MRSATARGFSLLELVVGMGVATIVASATGYVLVASMNETVKAGSYSQLDQLGREIKQSIVRGGKRCTEVVNFVTPIPASQVNGTGGLITTPVRITLPSGEIIQNGLMSTVGRYEIATVEFVNGEFKGRDMAGNSMFLGQIELRGRPGTTGSDAGKIPLKKSLVGSLMAVVNNDGTFYECFTADTVAAASICTKLGLQYDAVRGSCIWDVDMTVATGSNCNSSQPLVGITSGAKRCDRASTTFCSGSQFMSEFVKGRAICSDPPAAVAAAGPPPASAPLVTPVSAGPPGPAPAAGAEAPPQCSKISINQQCQVYCFDFFLGGSCDSSCPTQTDASSPCAVVESNVAPPPLPPPAPPPPDPRAPASQCMCGDTVISNGQYCGYCYREFEPETSYYGRRLDITIREETYQCNSGVLTYSPVANPNRGNCNGDYEVW